MGEAKRRKQLLGSQYGQPLGLTATARRKLIKDHLEPLLCQHYQACGYTDWLDRPCRPEIRSSSPHPSTQFDLAQLLEGLVQHWQHTFPAQFSRSALQIAVQSLLENRPLVLTPLTIHSLEPQLTMEPIIALPEARSYFQHQLALGRIFLAQHYNLLQDVLTVLAQESARPLLQQLLLTEFNDVIAHAEAERLAWIAHSLQPDGWIDLTDEVLFQAGNCALLGLLTLIECR